MGTQAVGLSRSGFVKSYVMPALWVFLIPVCSLGVFRHIQAGFDRDLAADVVSSIQRDRSLTGEEQTASIVYIREVPLSTRFASPDPQFAELSKAFSSRTHFAYFTFRWMIRLSLVSIISSIVVFV